jgi:hypothetical protein
MEEELFIELNEIKEEYNNSDKKMDDNDIKKLEAKLDRDNRAIEVIKKLLIYELVDDVIPDSIEIFSKKGSRLPYKFKVIYKNNNCVGIFKDLYTPRYYQMNSNPSVDINIIPEHLRTNLKTIPINRNLIKEELFNFFRNYLNKIDHLPIFIEETKNFMFFKYEELYDLTESEIPEIMETIEYFNKTFKSYNIPLSMDYEFYNFFRTNRGIVHLDLDEFCLAFFYSNYLNIDDKIYMLDNTYLEVLHHLIDKSDPSVQNLYFLDYYTLGGLDKIFKFIKPTNSINNKLKNLLV